LAATLAGFLRPASERPFIAQRLANAIARIRRTFRAHLPLYVLTAGYIAASLLLLSRYGGQFDPRTSSLFLQSVAFAALFWLLTLAMWDLVQLWRSGAPRGLANLLLERMVRRLLKGDRLGNSFHTLMTVPPMIVAFTAVKQIIPLIQPFSWDRIFARWDQIIGFGRMPWEILQPMLGYPAITVAINFAYDSWFLLMFAFLIGFGFSARSSALRFQFLIAFCCAWIVPGTLCAIAFSSAGPCYYSHLYPGPSPFSAQMAYLYGIGADLIWSLTVQEGLWHSYIAGAGALNGISAMPSMHVVVAVLLASAGNHINRKLGAALWTFTVVIMLGAVHLMWHYAVDVIAGAWLGLCCWWIGGYGVRHWCGFVENRPQ
jgi:hypothetical protein